jgi:hypothetical protein
MRFRLGRSRGEYICSKDCELCEGDGFVEGGDVARFCARTMELSHDTERVPCPNAEWDEYEPPEMDKAEMELRRQEREEEI